METKRGKKVVGPIVVFFLISLLFIAFGVIAKPFSVFLFSFAGVFHLVGILTAIFGIRSIGTNHIDRIPCGFYRCLDKSAALEFRGEKYYSLVLLPLEETEVIHVMVPVGAMLADYSTEYLIVERKEYNVVLNVSEAFLRAEGKD